MTVMKDDRRWILRHRISSADYASSGAIIEQLFSIQDAVIEIYRSDQGAIVANADQSVVNDWILIMTRNN